MTVALAKTYWGITHFFCCIDDLHDCKSSASTFTSTNALSLKYSGSFGQRWLILLIKCDYESLAVHHVMITTPISSRRVGNKAEKSRKKVSLGPPCAICAHLQKRHTTKRDIAPIAFPFRFKIVLGWATRNARKVGNEEICVHCARGAWEKLCTARNKNIVKC